jgi:tRNA threonylcarbamoyladenosine biosynthesis protein TsaE
LESLFLADDAETRAWAAGLAGFFCPGDVVLLDGPLGAGKTTWVRGLMHGLGYLGAVRSPTFNLIQTFDTSPPVMHADLYRVKGSDGIGIEEYLDTHVCLIEWPDRAVGLVDPSECWRITIAFEQTGRRATIDPPVDALRGGAHSPTTDC